MSTNAKLLALTFAIFVAVFASTHIANFPGTVSHFREVTGGQQILDLRPALSADDAYARLTAMGDAGRAAYLRLILVVDIVFPLSAFAFLFALARVARARVRALRVASTILLALPFAYLAFDLLENLMVLRLLVAFPERADIAGTLVGWLTRLKRGTQLAAFFAPLIALLWARIRRPANIP